MTEFWLWLTENFNNREIAGAFWLAFTLSILFLKREIRNGFFNVIKAMFAPKLLLLFIVFAVVVTLWALLAMKLGFWTSKLTPFVVWYFVGGLPLLVRTFDAKEGSRHFRGYVRGVLSGFTVIEFVYTSKIFSLVVELLVAPIVTFVALLEAFSSYDKRHSAVNKLSSWLLVIFASIVFLSSVYEIWVKPEDFFTTTMLKTFILPIYLTIASTPFFYLAHCYSHIEIARIQINRKSFQSDELKAYAKRRFFLTFMLRPWLLRRATRQFHIIPAKEKEDVDRIINEILQHERDEENLPSVDNQSGWSPHLAREFLADEGMRTGDYHSGFNYQEWWCGVTTKELEESALPSTANFSYSGVAGLVTKLKLRGHFVDEFSNPEALREFLRIARLLIDRALQNFQEEFAESKLNEIEPFEVVIGETRIKFVHERFSNDMGFELTLELLRPANN